MKKFTKILAVCMLVVMVAMTFASCGVLSIDLYKSAEKLAKKDYYCEISNDDGELWLEAEEDDGDNWVEIIKFDSVDDANDYLEEIEDEMNYYGDHEEDVTYGRKGKVVYWGTVDAVKDALGFPANLFITKK